MSRFRAAAATAFVLSLCAAPGALASVRLTGEVLPGLAHATSLGAPAGDASMTIAVAVAGRNSASEQAAYRAIYTVGSAQYHRFLRPAQIAARFGAPVARWRAVRAWLTRGGLRVVYASGTRDLLLATGTAAKVARLLSVQLRVFRHAGGSFIANTNA